METNVYKSNKSVPPSQDNTVRYKILCIDDEPLNNVVTDKILSDEYEVYSATSGQEGLKLADRISPDIILLDVAMPDLNGYDVLLNLQKNSTTKYIPVIFVSSLREEYNEETGLNLGAVDYIIKPIKPGVMKARIRNHLIMKNSAYTKQSKNTSDAENRNKSGSRKPYLKPDQIENLKEVLNYVLIEEELYLNEDIRISQVSMAMGIKSHHLQELLNRHLKTTFIQLIKNIRIEKAIDLMKNYPEKKVIDIAYECGFQSKSAFNSSFKNITGMNPTYFRANIQHH